MLLFLFFYPHIIFVSYRKPELSSLTASGYFYLAYVQERSKVCLENSQENGTISFLIVLRRIGMTQLILGQKCLEKGISFMYLIRPHRTSLI